MLILFLVALLALLLDSEAITAAGTTNKNNASFAELDKDGDNKVSAVEMHNWFDDFRVSATYHFQSTKDSAGKLSKVSFIESAAHWHPIHDAQVKSYPTGCSTRCILIYSFNSNY